MSRPDAVVKVGGSLLDWPGLPSRLAEYLACRRDDRLVVVVGGGRAADVVRELDRVHTLGDERSHRLALHALDLTAHLLAALVPGLVVVERLEDLAAVWDTGQVAVAAPRSILDQVEARSGSLLPRSWEVTSDSIAATVAAHLGCGELVLMKSAPLPPWADRREAARLGLVDPYFCQAARTLDRIDYLCLRDTPAPTEPRRL